MPGSHWLVWWLRHSSGFPLLTQLKIVCICKYLQIFMGVDSHLSQNVCEIPEMDLLYSHGINGLFGDCDTPLRLSFVDAVGTPAEEGKWIFYVFPSFLKLANTLFVCIASICMFDSHATGLLGGWLAFLWHSWVWQNLSPWLTACRRRWEGKWEYVSIFKTLDSWQETEQGNYFKIACIFWSSQVASKLARFACWLFKLHYQLGLARTSQCDHSCTTDSSMQSGREDIFHKIFERQKKRVYFVDCLYVQLLHWVLEKLWPLLADGSMQSVREEICHEIF